MLASLAPARRRLFLGLAAAALAGIVVAVVLVVHNRPEAVKPVSQDAVPPVLLVPGYGGSQTALDVLAAALRSHGRQADVVTLVDDNRGDLRQQADRLDTLVHQTLTRTGSPTVDLVGYSAGGLVVRLWVKEHDSNGLVRRVVTLSSPHHGTALAGLASDIAPDACPTACQQLAPDSSLLRSVNSGDETPPGPLWVSLWTTDDKTVTPPDSASLAGATDFSIQSVCPSVVLAHKDVPSNPTVIAMTLFELGRADPTVPGPDVCA